MSKLSTSAKRSTQTKSATIEGREKVSTQGIIQRFPDGISLIDVDVFNGQNGSYPVFAIAEDPKIYFNGGKVLMDIVNGWLELYNGDLTQIQADLKAEPVRIRLSNKKSKNGKTYVNVEVLN